MAHHNDMVSEDLFYENLLLGVTKVLESNQRVSNIVVEKRWPADRMCLSSWEQRHCASLPDDLRQFYLSTDGFRLKWSFQYSNEEILPVGLINVNTLTDLNLTPQLKEMLDNAANNHHKGPQISPKSKVFELDDCKSIGKVCLVYSDGNWTIWLLENEGWWTWLADSFVNYFRMALVHQGLPRWQAVFTRKGLPSWAEQLFLLMAPHLLNDCELSKTTNGMCTDAPLNHIDPTIFKITTKHSNRGTNPKKD